MSSQPVAPVIPSLTRPAVRAGGRTGQGRRLPLATVPEVPALADDVVYGAARIDASGRVGDQAFTSALGWRPGDRLTLTAADGVVIARRDPAGLVTMPAKPYIVIPSALRRRCGLLPGDRVLLAMYPGQDAMAAYSFAVADEALRAHAPLPRADGGPS
jgi:bifunctional DNA-binding transcriptional regulator/antitoxin component of YhaV-PrlF toxin-antitoxin module